MSDPNSVHVTVTITYGSETVTTTSQKWGAGNPRFAPRVAREAVEAAGQRAVTMLAAVTGDIDRESGVDG